MAKIGRGNTLLIEDWMFDLTYDNGKRITDTELHVYALIYGFSKHGAGCMWGERDKNTGKDIGPIRYAAKRLRASTSTVKLAFRNLCAGDFIKEIDPKPSGSTETRKWAVTAKSQANKPMVNPPKKGSGLKSGTEHFDPSIMPDQMPQIINDNRSGLNFNPEGHISTDFSDSSGLDFNPVAGQFLTSSGTNSIPEQEVKYQYGQCKNTSQTKQNTSKSSSLPSPITTPTNGIEGVDQDFYDECINQLMDESLNKNAKFEEVKQAYLLAIAKGYSPKQIFNAYTKRYIPRERDKNPTTTRFAMRLDKYLTDSRGLRWDAPEPKRTQLQQSAKDVQPQTAHQYFLETSNDYKALIRKREQLYIELCKAQTNHSVCAAKRVDELNQSIETLNCEIESYLQDNYSTYRSFIGLYSAKAVS